MKDPAKPRHRKMLVLIVFLALLAVAVSIFAFSSENTDQSNETSGVFARLYLQLTVPNYTSLPLKEQTRLIEHAQHTVRKCAHFLEFAALGFLLRLFLYGVRVPGFPAAVLTQLLGSVYAALDEYHQKLGGTRSGQWQDVALDSAGVLFGLLIATLVVAHRLRKKKRAEQP